MSEQHHVPLPGSARPELVGAESVGPVDAAERLELTVVLRRRGAVPTDLIEGPDTVTPTELADRFGADPADVELVRTVLGNAGIDVTDVHPASRRVFLAGPAGTLGTVFGAELNLVRSADPVTGQPVTHRARTGELHVPAELDGIVLAVLGLDTRPQARTQHRLHQPHKHRSQPPVSYKPTQFVTTYEFPANTDGSGQIAAVIELGGGFSQSDLDTHFSGLGLATPTVTAVGVDGAQNAPGKDPNGADGEVLLDIEVLGALAPKAHQLVYFGPNTDQGFVDAVSTAVHATPTPAVVSISWGQYEEGWTPQGRTALDQTFADAAALGVTVCVAAGDNGSSDAQTDGAVHVDFPASSPHALACGGTSLRLGANGGVHTETVWNDGANGGATGGGVSTVFPVPSWQANVGVPSRVGAGTTGRGVPDVAGDADPDTGYQVLVDGNATVIGGTSAVAPLWAALVCRLVQGLGKGLGLLQPALYGKTTAGKAATGFRDITSGSNGAYSAKPGWDACTGLGVPNGTALLAVLKAAGLGGPKN